MRPAANKEARELGSSESGFSLTELMIVLVVIGILALMALPRFMTVAVKAKMTEAKLLLRQVHTLQTGFYFEHDRYAGDLAELHFEQPLLVTEGGTGRYRLSVERTEGDGFVALATAVVDFDRDGRFNVWQVDQDGLISERTPD